MTVSRGEAQSVVEANLAIRKPARPMTNAEMSAFCRDILSRLDFSSRGGRAADIRKWALAWENRHFRDS
jgi:hypothetical protein